MLISAVLQKICALQLRCIVFADCVLGSACSCVMVTFNYAVLQALHAQISCTGFVDCVLVGVYSCLVIMLNIHAQLRCVVLADCVWSGFMCEGQSACH